MDYFYGDKDATIIIRRDDGFEAPLPVEVFFRPADAIEINKLASSDCTGSILDVGAGTGVHTLWLQDQGHRVCALDISSHACEIMRKRGVKNVVCADLMAWETSERFDTVLILGRSIGAVGNLSGLKRFLQHAHSFTKPNGEIVFNSLDVRRTQESLHLEYQQEKIRQGKYFGEIGMCFLYKGKQSQLTDHLHVDPETLASISDSCNWGCEILIADNDGDFLAKLTQSSESLQSGMTEDE